MKMEKVNLGYSLKNIPIPSDQSYLKNMIKKLESFINRLRWKAFFFMNKNQEEESENNFSNYGFKSENSAPACEDLKPFANDLYEMIRNIEFKSRSEVLKRNKFQQVINRDIKAINASNQLLVPADNTTNLYKVEKEDYERLLRNNITQKYKKVECSVMSAIKGPLHPNSSIVVNRY